MADGNAGLAALDRGAYDEAIRLFSRAINSGRLTGDDLELAYLNRGKAYVAKHDFASGVKDLRRAVQLSPTDQEAADALHAALNDQPGSSVAEAEATAPTDPWGALRQASGRVYWYEPAGADPHAEYLEMGWLKPEETIVFWVHSKAGLVIDAEYHLDAQSHKVLVAGLSGPTTWYGTASAGPGSWTVFCYYNNVPDRTTYSLMQDGSISVRDENYANGRWQPVASASLSETTKADLVAAGLRRR